MTIIPQPKITLSSSLTLPEEVALLAIREGGQRAKGALWGSYRTAMGIALLCEWVIRDRLTTAKVGNLKKTNIIDPTVAHFEHLLSDGELVNVSRWLQGGTKLVEAEIYELLKQRGTFSVEEKRTLFGVKETPQPVGNAIQLGNQRRAFYRAILMGEIEAPAAESLLITIMLTVGLPDIFKDNPRQVIGKHFVNAEPRWTALTDTDAIQEILMTFIEDRRYAALGT